MIVAYIKWVHISLDYVLKVGLIQGGYIGIPNRIVLPITNPAGAYLYTNVPNYSRPLSLDSLNSLDY